MDYEAELSHLRKDGPEALEKQENEWKVRYAELKQELEAEIEALKVEMANARVGNREERARLCAMERWSHSSRERGWEIPAWVLIVTGKCAPPSEQAM